MNLDNHSWHDLIKDHCSHSARPLVAVVGPTASGKTAFSIALAQYIGGEVINADSRQLYTGLNIGTAKITTEEMQGVPHHMIDVLSPNEEATVGWFQKRALQEADSILERGNIPLLVGGSMLYVSAITDGLSLAPPANAAIRKRLEEKYDCDDGKTLYQRLEQYDPEVAQRIHQNNKPRLVRAVEIFESGSHHTPKTQMWNSEENSPYDILILGVRIPREESVVKINNRCAAMFDAGWVKEVQQLLDAGYTASDPAMKSHGYKEIMQYILEGELRSQEELQESIAAKTRQYARRQMTWWKRDSRIHWIEPTV